MAAVSTSGGTVMQKTGALLPKESVWSKGSVPHLEDLGDRGSVTGRGRVHQLFLCASFVIEPEKVILNLSTTQ